MGRRLPCWVVALGMAMACAGAVADPATIPVDLLWRPPAQQLAPDETVEVQLFAVANQAQGQEFSILEVILRWDTLRLQLAGVANPCSSTPCPSGTYDWMELGFPASSPEGLNDSLDDGEALLWAISQLGMPAPVATPDGLWVATLRFQPLSSGVAVVQFVDRVGVSARTKVVTRIGEDVIGVLGPPATVTIVQCLAPLVSAIGARYISIAPALQSEAVAVSVSGDALDGAVACLTFWLQTDGSLALDPVYQTPVEWGEVAVTGWPIVPDAVYRIRSDCTPLQGNPVASAAREVQTWRWGDVNGDGVVFVDDVSLVFDGTQGQVPKGVRLESLDLAPCAPDGIVDDADVAAVQDAFNGLPFPCPSPCARNADLEELRLLVSCMAGPAPVSKECLSVDFDGDTLVDLADFAQLQLQFGLAEPIP